jgi:hypothetical protein
MVDDSTDQDRAVLEQFIKLFSLHYFAYNDQEGIKYQFTTEDVRNAFLFIAGRIIGQYNLPLITKKQSGVLSGGQIRYFLIVCHK